MRRNPHDDTRIVLVMFLVILLTVFVFRYLVLTYTPCSMFTLAEAPVRCVK